MIVHRQKLRGDNMLKTETLNIIEFNNGQLKKPVLIRYTIVINSNESQPYDEDALKLIGLKAYRNSLKQLSYIMRLLMLKLHI